MTPCNSSIESPRKDWVNILFLTLSPILAVPVLIWHTYQYGFEWWMPALFLIMYTCTGLSICAGYHRYYSHKSYECSKAVQVFYALFGAMAVQNTICTWSAGHRRHHSHPETDWDPYSIKRGFWWAHIVWIFYDNTAQFEFSNVPDLKKDPIAAWQHRWYKWIAFGMGLGVPLAVGACFGNPIAGLLWGGFLRIVMIHHSTFSVNSLAHHFGAQSYDETSTARDNWAVALLTFGEGYHSFHHRFPYDFRNGIRWYNWDPSKWFIGALKFTRLGSSLRTTSSSQIERTRMEVAVKALESRIANAHPTLASEIEERIAKAREAFSASMTLWQAQTEARARGQIALYKETYRQYRARLNEARQEWRAVLRAFKQIPQSD